MNVWPPGSVPAPTNAAALIYSPGYNRLVIKNAQSTIASIDPLTGQSSTHFSNTNFTDVTISPSGRYVFAADYGGENIGYGTPASTSFVHRLDLSTGIWDIRTAYIAGQVQAVRREAARRDGRDLPVVEVGHGRRVPHDRSQVGGDVHLALTDADDQRAAVAGRDQPVREARMDHGEAVGALDRGQRLGDLALQGVGVRPRDQVGQDLRVGVARELDSLVSTGEQVSCAMLAMALRDLGVPAVSLLGHQVRIQTNSEYGKARIESIDVSRIERAFEERCVAVVAGFPGVDGLVHVRPGTKRTSAGAKTVVRPAASRQAPPAQSALPSGRRMRNAISAPPSARFTPTQSQPEASGARYSLDHSWSSQASPFTPMRRPPTVTVPTTSRCGRL